MVLPNLSKIFPLPEYVESLSMGLDISDRSLKFVELKGRKKHLELGMFGSRVLPEGLVVSGEIKNKPGLIDFLKKDFAEFFGKEVSLSLPEEKALVGLVTLPVMPLSNIRETLELQLDEHIPLSPSETIFDFELLRPAVKDHLDVVLAAFPRKLVEDYRDVLVASGLKPRVFEMETQALVRSILPENEKDTVMIIDFGRTRTSFAIVTDGIIRFTSTVVLAGESINQILAKVFNIDVYGAERIKKENGFVRTKENQEVFNSILPIISAIRDEISRHLLYWQNHASHVHYPNPEVSKIYLCGGDSNLTGLTEYFSYELKIPVLLANPWVNITSFDDYIPEITLTESLTYATALGLALRSAKHND
ncbi:type IV pilus assembly protein PilM [Candidatus Giovannonibacteria bacterium]|nr:type IV pilus assembly protein PilM [Candidatus Giovannonibacteria bacterium]